MKKSTFKRMMALLLAVLMLFALVACGKKTENTDKPSGDKTDNAQTEVKKFDLMSIKLESVKKLSADKIGNVSSFESAGNGLYYEDNNEKFGVVTTEFELGEAKFTMLEPISQAPGYYKVTDKDYKNFKSTEEMNCVGLIDQNGNEVLSMEYGFMFFLNDRFVQVAKMTGIAEPKNTAFVYSHGFDDIFGVDYYTDWVDFNTNTFFNATWQIFDIQNKAFVSGIEGTSLTELAGWGGLVIESGVVYNTKGQAIDGAMAMFNGDYVLNGAVYDSESNKLFDVQDYTFTKESGDPANDVYCVTKAVDGATKYVVLNKNGEKISAEFDKPISVVGELVAVNDNNTITLCDLEGKAVSDKTASKVEFSSETGWYKLETNGEIAMIDKTGKLIKDFGAISEKNEKWYCFAQEKCTIPFNAQWSDYYVISEDKDGNMTFVEAFEGKTLFTGVSILFGGNDIILTATDGNWEVFKVVFE